MFPPSQAGESKLMIIKVAMSEINKKHKQDINTKVIANRLFNQNNGLSNSFRTFNSVQSYYSQLAKNEFLDKNPSVNCCAVKLSRFIAEEARLNGISYVSGSIPESSFSSWINKIKRTSLWNYCDNDKELCTIYLKQMIQIMKSASILIESKGLLVISKKYTTKNLYEKLLYSFWNKTPWKNIFPSSEEEANHLHSNRKEISHLLQQHGSRDLNSLYRDYSYATGHKSDNILFSISFIDFYLITWLRHFDILNYTQGSFFNPVTIYITEPGRNILQNLSLTK